MPESLEFPYARHGREQHDDDQNAPQPAIPTRDVDRDLSGGEQEPRRVQQKELLPGRDALEETDGDEYGPE